MIPLLLVGLHKTWIYQVHVENFPSTIDFKIFNSKSQGLPHDVYFNNNNETLKPIYKPHKTLWLNVKSVNLAPPNLSRVSNKVGGPWSLWQWSIPTNNSHTHFLVSFPTKAKWDIPSSLNKQKLSCLSVLVSCYNDTTLSSCSIPK